jgi:hypothetical protein
LTFNTNGTLNLVTTFPQNLTTLAGAWLTTGNAGTNIATNFLGTTDNMSFAMRSNNIERMRIFNTGQAHYNATTLMAGDVFSVVGNNYTGATNWAIGPLTDMSIPRALVFTEKILPQPETDLPVFTETFQTLPVSVFAEITEMPQEPPFLEPVKAHKEPIW